MLTGAGEASSFPDSSYKDVVFLDDRAKLLAHADVVMAVQPPSLNVIDDMKAESILICFVYASHQQELVAKMIEKKITCDGADSAPHALSIHGRPVSRLKDNIITIAWTDEVVLKTALTHDGKVMGTADKPAKAA